LNGLFTPVPVTVEITNIETPASRKLSSTDSSVALTYDITYAYPNENSDTSNSTSNSIVYFTQLSSQLVDSISQSQEFTLLLHQYAIIYNSSLITATAFSSPKFAGPFALGIQPSSQPTSVSPGIKSSSSNKLSKSAVIGIIVGVILFVLILIAVLVVFYLSLKRSKNHERAMQLWYTDSAKTPRKGSEQQELQYENYPKHDDINLYEASTTTFKTGSKVMREYIEHLEVSDEGSNRSRKSVRSNRSGKAEINLSRSSSPEKHSDIMEYSLGRSSRSASPEKTRTEQIESFERNPHREELQRISTRKAQSDLPTPMRDYIRNFDSATYNEEDDTSIQFTENSYRQSLKNPIPASRSRSTTPARPSRPDV
jgi:hypothetical protein